MGLRQQDEKPHGRCYHLLQGHGTAELIQTEEGPRIIAFGGTRAYLCPGDSHFTPETDQSILR